jgi:murein DD-endopeptidase MepM/ murein hydrolase activator NlpD
MMLSPELCGAAAAVLLAPLLWSMGASALRALTERRAHAYGDRFEKLMLALMLAPSVIGIAAVLYALMPEAQSAHAQLLDLGFMDLGELAPPAALDAAPGVNSGLHLGWLAQAGLSAFVWIYCAGALFAALRLIAAQWRLWRIAAGAEDASAHWGAGAAITEAQASPFVGAGDKIILPRTLIAALGPAQMALVVAHERAHVRRGDGFYYALLAWADALFWFNPLVRAQTERCRLAAELACDAAVMAAAPEMRRAYAQALVSALKHTAGDALACAPAVFSTRIVGEHRMRIDEIMHPGPFRRKRSAWAVTLAACVAAAPFSALQMAMAQTESAAPASTVSSDAAPVAQAATGLFSVAPLAGEMSSAYGQRSDPRNGNPQFHNGVDYRADEGAAIVAPAAGRVVSAGVPEDRPGYGKVLVIDHGGGLVTRYAHLSAYDVSEGQEVGAGQVVARVGNTGFSTGPHLHFEVLRDGENVDPAELLP